MSKIISFSLWGNSKQYCCGAIENAKLAKVLFPDWTCRFYCGANVPLRVQNELKALGAEMRYRPAPMGFIGLFWRFEVAFDDAAVERFIVRDTDSRLTPRDKACVDEWIESGEPCHIIRDCESHGAWMLGATWGLVPEFIEDFRSLVADFWEEFHSDQTEHGFESSRGRFYGIDQEFLSRKVWPLIKDHHIAHDQHFHFTGREKRFPIQREYLEDMSKAKEVYIGQLVNLEKEYDNYEY